MKKRSVKISGHATSISIEEEFWEILQKIAEEQEKSLGLLISEIDKTRSTKNLSSATRLFVLHYLQSQIKDLLQ